MLEEPDRYAAIGFGERVARNCIQIVYNLRDREPEAKVLPLAQAIDVDPKVIIDATKSTTATNPRSIARVAV